MFNNGTTGYSLSDIAAATGDRNDDNFGGNGAWWIIILFLFAFCGWGGNGFGYGRNGAGAVEGAITRADLCQDMNFGQLENGVRGIQSGLCDGFYAMNTGMLNGFAGVQNTLTTGFSGVDNSICSLGYQTQAGINSVNVGAMQNTNAIQQDINANTVANMQNTNALQSQLADCCCENRAAIAQVRYDMATDTCAINTNASNNTRDIIDSQNSNTRAILEAIQQNKVDVMQDKITELTAQLTSANLAASQAAQNAYLVNELRPSPVPAYITANPYCNCGNAYSYGNCCGTLA